MILYYFDITNVGNLHSGIIFSKILSELHLNEKNTGSFAIDFPNYREGEEDIFLKENSAKKPQIGNKFRIFTTSKDVASKIQSLNSIQDYVKSNIITVSFIEQAPESNQYVSWVKNLTKDHINKKLKELKKNDFSKISKETLLAQIKTLRDKEEIESSKIIYLGLKSNSNKQNFSLFTEKLIIDKTDNFNPTSYGLSPKNELITLPVF